MELLLICFTSRDSWNQLWKAFVHFRRNHIIVHELVIRRKGSTGISLILHNVYKSSKDRVTEEHGKWFIIPKGYGKIKFRLFFSTKTCVVPVIELGVTGEPFDCKGTITDFDLISSNPPKRLINSRNTSNPLLGNNRFHFSTNSIFCSGVSFPSK